MTIGRLPKEIQGQTVSHYIIFSKKKKSQEVIMESIQRCKAILVTISIVMKRLEKPQQIRFEEGSYRYQRSMLCVVALADKLLSYCDMCIIPHLCAYMISIEMFLCTLL